MAFFDKVRDSLSVTGQGVTQKAKTAAETMKLNTQIKGNERAMEKLIYQIGLQCVEHHIQEKNTEYENLFQEIRRLRRENAELQKQVEYVNASKICPYCGYHNHTSSRFCSGCGNSLEVMPQQMVCCPECGAENEEDSRFCIHCGCRLQQEETEVIPEAPKEDNLDIGQLFSDTVQEIPHMSQEVFEDKRNQTEEVPAQPCEEPTEREWTQEKPEDASEDDVKVTED